MKRRDFLNQTGLILAALGINETGLIDWASRYQQALAQPARRKLALLIGINRYPQTALTDTNLSLQGCVNDIDLQRELLIHRLGFQTSDILTLTDEQATGQAIIEAIINHLYAQAQPGDAVILHFSGYGSQLRLSPKDKDQESYLNSWVPANAKLPSENHPNFNDLSEETLKSLLKLLKTKQLITFLDAGFSDREAPLVTGMRSRSRSVIPTGESLTETDALKQLFNQVGRPEAPNLFPGLLLRAAPPESWVIEQTWDDFSAGLFTYALTQTLWTALPATTIQMVMGQTQEIVGQQIATQSPQIAGQRQTEIDHLIYDTPWVIDTRSDGVITHVSTNGDTAEVWLGGFPSGVVNFSHEQSWVRIADALSKVTVQLYSQKGLRAKIKRPSSLDEPWQVGQPVYEAVRVLPKDLSLTIALDKSLERIERVDATSALSFLPFISTVTQEAQPADCLFGKPRLPSVDTLTASTTLNSDSPSGSDGSVSQSSTAQTPFPLPENAIKQGYGLFSSLHSLIPGSLAKRDEAVKAAVNRLIPKLQIVLATKLLRLTDNQRSSHLPVRLNLEMLAPQEKLLLQQETLRPLVSLPKSRLASSLDKQNRPLEISQGSQIRYRLFNFGKTPLYFILVNLDARNRLSIFFPSLPSQIPQNTSLNVFQDQLMILPGKSVTAPQSDLPWNIESPPGRIETYALFSQSPFSETLALISPLVATSSSQRIILGENALTVVQAILTDLDNDNTADKANPDAYVLSVQNWATLLLSYQVI